MQATKDAAGERVRQAKDAVTDDEGKPTPQVIIIAVTVVAIVVALVLRGRQK